MKKLFEEMQTLVNNYVKHYATDFEIDKDCILGRYPETLSASGVYYWYLRECGTEIMSAENLAWKETNDYTRAECWLSQALSIFRIDTQAQVLKPVPKAQMRNLLNHAKTMDQETKLKYVVLRLKSHVDCKIPAYDILYHAANQFKLTEPEYINGMIHNPRLTYESAIAEIEQRLASFTEN
ncbi:hypothetical protein CEB3_c13620 [Peptococcaceae bacterium CEB3]|nr:hypothetical protein CEB3_c13620 [Peptococcaceae bacterium CEB3]